MLFKSASAQQMTQLLATMSEEDRAELSVIVNELGGAGAGAGPGGQAGSSAGNSHQPSANTHMLSSCLLLPLLPPFADDIKKLTSMPDWESLDRSQLMRLVAMQQLPRRSTCRLLGMTMYYAGFQVSQVTSTPSHAHSLCVYTVWCTGIGVGTAAWRGSRAGAGTGWAGSCTSIHRDSHCTGWHSSSQVGSSWCPPMCWFSLSTSLAHLPWSRVVVSAAIPSLAWLAIAAHTAGAGVASSSCAAPLLPASSSP